MIINVSGDITLADANDAASYVQNLAGEEVNIIFSRLMTAGTLIRSVMPCTACCSTSSAFLSASGMVVRLSTISRSLSLGMTKNLAGEEVNIIFGAMYDAAKSDSCTITVIATGLEEYFQALLLHGASDVYRLLDALYRSRHRLPSGLLDTLMLVDRSTFQTAKRGRLLTGAALGGGIYLLMFILNLPVALKLLLGAAGSGGIFPNRSVQIP